MVFNTLLTDRHILLSNHVINHVFKKIFLSDLSGLGWGRGTPFYNEKRQ